ncbi:phosphotransferase [Kineococcus sp. SYSU DK006]|uniref:phosphotransferase n=1 Tax=Kineococcus sp. SYSU DK006 TaxID=3383127 RepID=UPI003D7E9878
MSGSPVSGIEQAVFGPLFISDTDGVDGWLDQSLHRHLGAGVAQVLFRSGRVSAVYGCRLHDGQQVAVKVHREGADTEHLAAAVRAQQHLADAGYPCPRPLAGPVVVEGRTLVAETMLTGGRWRDAREPRVRRALAVSLAEQVALLRSVPAAALRPGAPAWVRYEHGPWPAPHDPIFDFSSTLDGYAWLDDLAARAAAVLSDCPGSEVIGHSDWYRGNALFADGLEGPAVCAAFDWDSLAARPEAVIAGLSAGSHTLGGAGEGAAPTPAQAAAFLDDYDSARFQAFTAAERAGAAAAACWALAYNARCELSFLPLEDAAAPGTPLQVLSEHRNAYLELT